jgi:hypothetical protein
MKKVFPALTITSFILFASFILSDNPVERLNKALNNFFEKYPQEKVYLQFDKQHYTIGDTIWYKGYVTYKNAPSSISKILYVEIVDDNGEILKRQTLPVEEGGADGDFVLDGELPAGNYYIRSYTAWMMNFDPAFYFYNKIPIGLDENSDSQTESDDTANYHVDFFPEGGNLVEGLTSLVTFRSTNQNGSPQNTEGKIVDSSGKEIAELKTIHDGMGSFIIHPISGNHYSAIIELQNGEIKKIALPEIKKSGIIFHVETVNSIKGDSVYFRISRSINSKDLYEHLIICAEMQGVSDFTYINFDSATAGNYNNTILSAPSPLSIDQFPPGILHLTVFNESDGVLAQRLVFLHNKNQQMRGLELQSSQLNFTPHSKNTFVLNIPDDTKGNYSVSVTDADAEKENANGQNIISNVLVTSDIKNYVKDPGWYFQNNNESGIDLLMLTNEWSRFKWNNIMNNKFPQLKYYAEQSLMLKGRAYRVKKKSSEPLSDGEVPMMMKEQNGSLKDILSVPVDSAGYFTLANLDFYDTATIYVKNTAETKKEREQNITVQFERNPLDTVRYAFIPNSEKEIVGNKITNTDQAAIIKKRFPDTSANNLHKDKTLLSAVTIRAKAKTHTDSTIADYASGVFATPDAWVKTFDFTNDKIAAHSYQINVLQYIINNVPGLYVKYTNPAQTIQGEKNVTNIPIIAWRMNYSLFVPAKEGSFQRMLANVPAFFLNETQLTGEGGGDYINAMELLQSISVANLAMIRVYPPGTKVTASGNSSNGVIAVYTINKTEARDYDNINRFDRIKKMGYTKVQQFSSPDYNLRKNIQIPDSRTTLYWNPQLATDSTSHTVSFSFYNNDAAKRFHIVIEGIDNSGKIVRIDKIFQ